MDTDIRTLKVKLKNYRNLILFCQSVTSSQGNVKTHKQLSIITQAADILRLVPVHGEIYYKIIYYNYLSPEIYFYVFEILEALKSDAIFLSSRTYFRYKAKALKLLSEIVKISL